MPRSAQIADVPLRRPPVLPCCRVCGNPQALAVATGSATLRAPDEIAIHRRPARARCETCWPWHPPRASKRRARS